MFIVTSSGECRTPPGKCRGVKRLGIIHWGGSRRIGILRGRWHLGGAQIKDRSAVVSEIQFPLTIGDIDMVRQEEIRADEHVDIRDSNITNSQAGIANLLLSNLETGEWGNPGVQGPASESMSLPGFYNAGVARFNARPRGHAQRQDG